MFPSQLAIGLGVANAGERRLDIVLAKGLLSRASAGAIFVQKPHVGLQLTNRTVRPLKSSSATSFPSRLGSLNAGNGSPTGAAFDRSWLAGRGESAISS